MNHARPERRLALTVCAVVALAAAAALPVGTAAAAGYTRSVRMVGRCGYSKALHKEYACRVVTVRGPGYTRVDWFSVGLGVRTYPWERLVWQYRWQTASTRPTACRPTADGLPRSPTYRRSRWVTAERLTIFEGAHTVTAADGTTKRVAARVRRLPWGHKQLTIRRVSVMSCKAPNLGVQAALTGGAGLTPLSRVTIVADQSLAGRAISLNILGARNGAGGPGTAAVGVAWTAPETVDASLTGTIGGMRRTNLATGLPGVPSDRLGAGATVNLPLRAGRWILAVKGSAPSAPRATVSVVLTGGGVVPVTPGQGVLVAVPGGTDVALGLTLRAPAGIGAAAAARVSIQPVAGRGDASVAVVPLTVTAGAVSTTLSVHLAAAPGAYRLVRATVTWTAAAKASESRSFDLEVVGVPAKP